MDPAAPSKLKLPVPHFNVSAEVLVAEPIEIVFTEAPLPIVIVLVPAPSAMCNVFPPVPVEIFVVLAPLPIPRFKVLVALELPTVIAPVDCAVPPIVMVPVVVEAPIAYYEDERPSTLKSGVDPVPT